MSLRDFGYREMRVEKIGYADVKDIEARMKAPHVRVLSETYDLTGGPINAPVVRKSDRKLFSGHDRVAAARLLGRKTIVVHLKEGTDDEMAELALIENAYRRHDNQDALKRQLVELRAARLRGISGQGVRKPFAPGRPKSDEAVAREQIAPALKTTPEALRKAVYRDRRKEEVATAPADEHDDPTEPAAPEPPPIETFGLELSDELRAMVVAAQERIDKADRWMVQAVTSLHGLFDIEGYPRTMAQDARRDVRVAAEAVRSSRPAALCPWCKGQADIECMACQGCRFATRRTMENDPPPELLRSGAEAMVSVRGHYMTLAHWNKIRPRATAESADIRLTNGEARHDG